MVTAQWPTAVKQATSKHSGLPSSELLFPIPWCIICANEGALLHVTLVGVVQGTASSGVFSWGENIQIYLTHAFELWQLGVEWSDLFSPLPWGTLSICRLSCSAVQRELPYNVVADLQENESRRQSFKCWAHNWLSIILLVQACHKSISKGRRKGTHLFTGGLACVYRGGKTYRQYHSSSFNPMCLQRDVFPVHRLVFSERFFLSHRHKGCCLWVRLRSKKTCS